MREPSFSFCVIIEKLTRGETVKPKSEKKCKNCPNIFRPYRSTDKFCSPKCAMEYGKEHAKKSNIYREPAKRPKAKSLARERDRYTCQLSLSNLLLPEHQHNRHMIKLEVHHIIFLSEGVYDEDWNLITLCEQCHKNIAHKYKRIYQWRLLQIVNGTDWSFIYEKHPQLRQKVGFLLSEAADSMLR